MSFDSFQYQLLNESKQEIRLLSLLPPAADGTICLQLETAPLADVRNQYDAISYTWGDPPATYSVRVNGKRLYVRENIFRFLKRYPNLMFKEPSKIWIDCICINQEDNNEKSWQVAIMTEIFRSATQVLMWLGKASQQVTLRDLFSVHFPRRYERPYLVGQGIGSITKMASFQLSIARTKMQDFCFERFNVGRRLCLYTLGKPCTESCSCSIFAKYRITKGSDRASCTDERAEQILGTLLGSTYWQRLWIVPEFLAARQAMVVVSDSRISLDTLHRALQIRRFKQSPQSSRLLDYIFAANHKTKLSGGGLRRLIFDCRLQLCSDPRDRVYGLLGISEWAGKFTVDYSCSKEELFVRLLDYFQDSESCEPARAADNQGMQLKDSNVETFISALGITSATLVAHTQQYPAKSSAFYSNTFQVRFSLNSFRLTPCANNTFSLDSVRSMPPVDEAVLHLLGYTTSASMQSFEVHELRDDIASYAQESAENNLLFLCSSVEWSRPLLLRHITGVTFKIEGCLNEAEYGSWSVSKLPAYLDDTFEVRNVKSPLRPLRCNFKCSPAHLVWFLEDYNDAKQRPT